MKSWSCLLTALLLLRPFLGGAEPSTPPAPPPAPGGYQKVAATDRKMLELAEFAVAQAGSQQAPEARQLATLESAEMQVVAGTNYRLRMLVTTVRGDKRRAEAVVHLPLPYAGGAKARRLLSWKWL